MPPRPHHQHLLVSPTAPSASSLFLRIHQDHQLRTPSILLACLSRSSRDLPTDPGLRLTRRRLSGPYSRCRHRRPIETSTPSDNRARSTPRPWNGRCLASSARAFGRLTSYDCAAIGTPPRDDATTSWPRVVVFPARGPSHHPRCLLHPDSSACTCSATTNTGARTSRRPSRTPPRWR
jgi:hypothetical protein